MQINVLQSYLEMVTHLTATSSKSKELYYFTTNNIGFAVIAEFRWMWDMQESIYQNIAYYKYCDQT